MQGSPAPPVIAAARWHGRAAAAAGRHVLLGGRPRQQRGILEHVADVARRGRRAVPGPAGRCPAGPGRRSAATTSTCRNPTAPAGRRSRLPAHLQGGVAQRLDPAGKPAADVADGQHRRCGAGGLKAFAPIPTGLMVHELQCVRLGDVQPLGIEPLVRRWSGRTPCPPGGRHRADPQRRGSRRTRRCRAVFSDDRCRRRASASLISGFACRIKRVARA